MEMSSKGSIAFTEDTEQGFDVPANWKQFQVQTSEGVDICCWYNANEHKIAVDWEYLRVLQGDEPSEIDPGRISAITGIWHQELIQITEQDTEPERKQLWEMVQPEIERLNGEFKFKEQPEPAPEPKKKPPDYKNPNSPYPWISESAESEIDWNDGAAVAEWQQRRRAEHNKQRSGVPVNVAGQPIDLPINIKLNIEVTVKVNKEV